MTGTQLSTFCEELNGGASIGETLLFQFINLAKALVEQRRPWMVLRSTDSSKSVAAGNTWQTAIDLSTIARFNRFYGDCPIRLFDGTNRIERYRQVPFEERLSYKDVPNTFVYDEATKTLYLNGTVAYHPVAPLGVWYINLEDPADEIERRIAAAIIHYGIDPAYVVDGLFTDSGRDQQFVVVKSDGKKTMVVNAVVDALIQEIKTKNIDVLIVDPFVSTHEVEENSNSEIQKVAAQWVRIAHEGNCAVELVHHRAQIPAQSTHGNHGSWRSSPAARPCRTQRQAAC